MIQIHHLQKKYSDIMPLKDVNTTIHKGDVISLIGPSGCGKSTFLRCINMLDPPTGGQIFLCGEEITKKGYNLTKLRMKVGMVFQSYELFNHQTVVENIMRPQMKLLGKSKQEAYDRAYELLSLVGLVNKQFQFPEQLSGGQKQRIAIARALGMNPDILLLDEPTSALDPTMVGEVEAVIQNLAKKGTTMMLVTHDMSFARSVSNRVFYMDEGGIYEEGTPDQIFLNPQKEKTRLFIKKQSMLEIKAYPVDFDHPNAMAEIERFGARQGLDRKTINKLQMVIEELCIVFLSPDSKTEAVSILVEYDEKKDQINVIFKYDSDIILDDNQYPLSMAIIRRFSETFTTEAIHEDKYSNRLVLKIGKGG